MPTPTNAARTIGFVALIIGAWFLVAVVRTAWTSYWLLTDGQRGTATVTTEHSHDFVDYTYTVNEKTYSGGSQRNWQVEQDRNVRPGQRSAVYFSASHPWLSRLSKPTSLAGDLPALVFALLFMVMGAIAIMNPKSKIKVFLRPASNGTRSVFGSKGRRIAGNVAMRLRVVKSPDDVPPELGDGVEKTVLVKNVQLYRLMGADGREQTFHSLDEMPPEIRASVEQAFNDPQSAIVGKEARGDSAEPLAFLQGSTIPAGKFEIDGLLGEIPPEIQKKIDELAADPESAESFTFQFQGPDGRERTFYSLQEMPPDIRAIYDQLTHLKIPPKSDGTAKAGRSEDDRPS